MGFSMFVIPLLLATVSGLSLNKNSMMTQLFDDPKSFVATFQNADPDQIQAVIDMIDGLLNTGSEEKQAAIDAFDLATAAATAAATAKDDATNAEFLALGIKKVATDDVDTWTNKVTVAAADETTAQSELTKATEDLSSYQTNFDIVTVQIDAEKKALEGIQDVLAKLSAKASTRRRLLAMIKVDPSALDSVNDIVQDLIDEGEVERAESLKALATAKTDKSLKSDTYNTAVTNHVTLQGELDEKKVAKTAAIAAAVDATALQLKKVDEDAAAQVVLGEKTKIKDDETARVDGENKTLEDVKKMLQDLL